jgi:hypothetical protein
MPPLAEYRNNGTGRLVAVIGDSMTAQMRDTILRDRRFDWFVLARCGTAIYLFDHPNPKSGAGLPEAFAQLLFLRPQALIITLGITDVTRHLDYVPSMRTLLDMTSQVPCRSWVGLWPNPHMGGRYPGGEEAFIQFNRDLQDALAGTDVRYLDWGDRVGRMPVTPNGYHPWLNPIDWVHLLPGQGFEQRLALMETGLEGCF